MSLQDPAWALRSLNGLPSATGWSCQLKANQGTVPVFHSTYRGSTPTLQPTMCLVSHCQSRKKSRNWRLNACFDLHHNPQVRHSVFEVKTTVSNGRRFQEPSHRNSASAHDRPSASARTSNSARIVNGRRSRKESAFFLVFVMARGPQFIQLCI